MMAVAIVFLPGISWAKTVFNPFTGTLDFVDSGAGAGGSGGSSLAIATGSVQAANVISSPTAIINFSSGPFRVTFVSPATAYIDVDYSSITAQGKVTASGGGGAVFGYISTRSIDMNGFELIGSSRISVGSSTGAAAISISSPNASLFWVAVRVDTGAETPLFDLRYASATLAKPVTFYILGPLIQGSTVSNQNDSGGQQTYILRMGPQLNGAMINSVYNGSNEYLLTSGVNGTSRFVFMNATGGKFELGIAAGPVGFIGTFTNQALQFRVGDAIMSTLDTTGNLGAAASATQKVLYGYVVNMSSGVATSSFTAYGEITSTTGFVGGGSTFTALAVNGPSAFSSTSTFNAFVNIPNASSASIVNAPLMLTSGGANKYFLMTSSITNVGTQYKTNITTNGVITSSGIAPALTSCGTNPTVVGNDRRMVLTEGATGNGCTITFAVPFLNAPTCFVDNRTMSLVNALSYAVTNTALTIIQTASGGGVYDVWCDGLGE